jgi:predicted membrane channel-forming protein YqfA (hemolysin III family)
MNKRHGKYIYSDKKHTEKGIFSSILALISFLGIAFLVFSSYLAKGDIRTSAGAAAFLCTMFSLAGVMLGVLGKKEPDKFYLFSYIGITWNIIDLLIISVILYAGI